MTLTDSEMRRISASWIALQYARGRAKDEHWWAFEELCDLIRDAPSEAWKVIHAIRHLDGSDFLLANLAAGPLEDLLVAHGWELIGEVETLARHDPQFKKVLGAVWQQGMPADLWARIEAVAGPSW